MHPMSKTYRQAKFLSTCGVTARALIMAAIHVSDEQTCSILCDAFPNIKSELEWNYSQDPEYATAPPDGGGEVFIPSDMKPLQDIHLTEEELKRQGWEIAHYDEGLTPSNETA